MFTEIEVLTEEERLVCGGCSSTPSVTPLWKKKAAPCHLAPNDTVSQNETFGSDDGTALNIYSVKTCPSLHTLHQFLIFITTNVFTPNYFFINTRDSRRKQCQ